jgi:N-acyl amino acid synthase of PEP-CTERM/exosortase system
LDRSLKKTTSSLRNGQSPVARFDTYFRAVSADTRELIDKAFALRYQVYCLERQFEDPSQQPRGLETDEFDRHSVHSLVFHRPQQEPIGTARLILPQARPNSLPIQDLLKKTGMNASNYFPNHAVAEVSRFAISKEFRRRKVEAGAIPEAEAKRERHGNLPCLGLIQMLLRQSVELGIEYWGAVMEPQLLRMLALMGIRFQPIGPLVSYHGLRQPSFCHLPVMVRNMALTKPESWAVVTNNGELMPARAEFETELRRVA